MLSKNGKLSSSSDFAEIVVLGQESDSNCSLGSNNPSKKLLCLQTRKKDQRKSNSNM